MKLKQTILTALCLSLLLSAGCSAEPLKSGKHPPISQSAWMVYWDEAKGMADFQKHEKQFDSISYFAIRMDAKGHFRTPKELSVKEAGKPFYLTFVNDVARPGGVEISKDTDILKVLLKDERSRSAHAKEIVDIAKAYGAAGIDLDYEKIATDPEILKNFAAFTGTLYVACLAEKIPLRIILEPSVPFDTPFSAGPEYVVMLYNLYGTHGGPGPKADGAFIERTIQKMEALPPKRAVAFSNGGCLWKDYGFLGLKKGTARFISGEDAVKLARVNKITPERDPDSAALHFSYTYDGSKYEVWYADQETLDAWITLAANKGMPEAILWRLGG